MLLLGLCPSTPRRQFHPLDPPPLESAATCVMQIQNGADYAGVLIMLNVVVETVWRYRGDRYGL